MTEKRWTVESVLAEIDRARFDGDPNYEDIMLLKLAEVVREPKKLIIFREQGMGGVLYNINSNVKFDEVITVDQIDGSMVPNADDLDEIESLSVDGDYGSASWLIDSETLEMRIEHWKARGKMLEAKREESDG